MINPFLLSPAERLNDWKAFRRALPDMTEAEQLDAVAAYWAKAPLVKLAYDSEAPDTWPTIWEMIHAGQWCRQSVAIGMAETLRLSGWDPKRMTLRVFIDRAAQESGLVLRIDTVWALNYHYGVVVPYPPTANVVLREWQWSGRGYTGIGD